jgi:hypothetical protein
VHDLVVLEVGLVHRVDHLRRDEHGHRRALLLVAADVLVELLAQMVAECLLELREVLDGVGALPLGALPLLVGDVLVAGKASPVGLHELALERVLERLLRGMGFGVAVAGTHVLRLLDVVAHGCTPPWFVRSDLG